MEYTKASSTFAEKRESSNLSEGTNISGLIDGDTIIDYQDDFILVREFVGSYLIVHKECFTSDDIYAPVSKYLGKVQCANCEKEAPKELIEKMTILSKLREF